MTNTHSETTRNAAVAAEWPELSEGQRTWRVAVVEYVLADLGYYGLRIVDERFGPALTEALTAYRADRGLEDDTGRVDAATWEQLTEDFGVVVQGHEGSRVRAVQYALNEGHGGGLAVDGIFGSATHSAVVSFQREAKLRIVDGEVGPETFPALITRGA
ncbi:peptidoglycan hydrolase-like protein with peptidoglycan-binding domain [Nocardiopsis arvandica]|uniref:Peptidoglycan hydrolase-like protein with peptidoglycan-binding domain n=1 Tax=Nocardiopsis sinuspersici TaxID=501010 RepID=A0A7Z0BJK6_9ACTN|nr:peptidoglycan-binding protein [Nocardiopsis sinuspersici]NYH53221.1 peptidoglycan hydrolase-like protein with peptidoglycan-binding domain [Nocardiopsis sinuspersici]